MIETLTPASLPKPSGKAVRDSDRLYEIVKGKRVEKTVGASEINIANLLEDFITDVVRLAGTGQAFIEMPYVLPLSGNMRKPDVSFLSAATWPLNRRFPSGLGIPVAPDLAVEVISPNELTWASLEKVEEYFAEGTKQVWLVFRNIEAVYCYTSPKDVTIVRRGDELVGDPLIPGFRIPVERLFPKYADDE